MGSLHGSSNSWVTRRSLSFIRTGNFSMSANKSKTKAICTLSTCQGCVCLPQAQDVFVCLLHAKDVSICLFVPMHPIAKGQPVHAVAFTWQPLKRKGRPGLSSLFQEVHTQTHFELHPFLYLNDYGVTYMSARHTGSQPVIWQCDMQFRFPGIGGDRQCGSLAHYCFYSSK